MCQVATIETKQGPAHRQCIQEVYGEVVFLNIPKGPKLLYWCPHCGKIEGSSLTPEQLFTEWEQKGIKFKFISFAEI